ncbi:MAG: selenocysteine-specific translation elongation factor [Dehalococcoidia bacterium]|nr:selenocysteine-specific translation elongation factor [Dehalococcoidia bacterium]
MHVIGTAGHVDHGKSTLVHALTGIDPDRLQEEKVRGMTIDLGFAWLELPSGREVSIVDVPGHERFIKNMLAGVGGIDLAMLLVAADEGVMPQTREHLAIIDLLRIGRGVVVLTKRDLVDAEWLELVESDVRQTVEGTSLGDAAVIAVSATTREGLPELLGCLDASLDTAPPRRDIGRPRLPIDRVFSIAGFGTVVTGTLIDGTLRVGQEIEVVPQGISARIRGLQTHRKKVDVATPGSRVAVNLANVAVDDVARGDVVTTSGWMRPTNVVDAELRLVSAAAGPLHHNANVTLHTLASEAPARVRLLDRDELAPGDTGWAQIRAARPLAVAKGDGFIIRSSSTTLGGGTIIDPYPKRHKRLHAATLAGLATLGRGSPRSVLLQHLERQGPVDATTLLKSADISQSDGLLELHALIDDGAAIALGSRALEGNTLLFAAPGWQRVVELTRQALSAHHRQFPLRSGMPKEELRTRLRLPARAAGEAVDRLIREGVIEERSAAVGLPEHQVIFDQAMERQAADLVAGLEREPYSPPDVEAEADFLAALVDQQRIVRVGDSIYFSAGVYGRMVEQVRAFLGEHQKITVAEVRDLFGTSRKYALALMEHLDEQRVTRRVGDARVAR